MTTDEQRAKWLKTWVANGTKFNTSPDVDWFAATPDVAEKISAAITPEAVAAERSRVAEGAGMTDEELGDACWKIFDLLNHGDNMKALDLARTLIAEAIARERERMREPLIDVLVHLIGAHSLLSRLSKKAAPSNKMFDQMLVNYERNIKRGRAAITELDRLIATLKGETK